MRNEKPRENEKEGRVIFTSSEDPLSSYRDYCNRRNFVHGVCLLILFILSILLSFLIVTFLNSIFPQSRSYALVLWGYLSLIITVFLWSIVD